MLSAETFKLMPDSNGDDGSRFQSVKGSLEGTKAEIATLVDDLSNDVSTIFNDTIEGVDKGAGDLGAYLQNLGNEAAEVLQTVLTEAEDYIRENDIEVEMSGNKIRMEGDEVGLKKIETVLESKGIDAEYHRDEGLDISFDKNS